MQCSERRYPEQTVGHKQHELDASGSVGHVALRPATQSVSIPKLAAAEVEAEAVAVESER